MDMLDYAKQELLLAGYLPTDLGYSRRTQAALLQLLKAFEAQGWLTSEAPGILDMFQKLGQYQPLSPLTGGNEEWVEVETGTKWRNKRCSTVFKEATGRAYDTHAIIFIDANGRQTPKIEKHYIRFPYTPTTEFVKSTIRTTVQPPKKS